MVFIDTRHAKTWLRTKLCIRVIQTHLLNFRHNYFCIKCVIRITFYGQNTSLVLTDSYQLKVVKNIPQWRIFTPNYDPNSKMIRSLIESAFQTGYLSVESEGLLLQMLSTKSYLPDDLTALFTLRDAVRAGSVKREASSNALFELLKNY
jgi:hypothetical protein